MKTSFGNEVIETRDENDFLEIYSTEVERCDLEY